MSWDAKDAMLEACDSSYAVMVGEIARFGTWRSQPVDSVSVLSERALPDGVSCFEVEIVANGTLHTRSFYADPDTFSRTALAVVTL